MGDLHSISEVAAKCDGPVTVDQQEILKRAVAKLVLIGDQVGVSTSDMISLLESGLTVGELLEYLALRDSGVS
jgi:hypothetical protein